MAIVAVTTSTTFEFISSSDTDSAAPTRFRFRPLTSGELARCGVSMDGSGFSMPASQAINIATMAFDSVAGFVDTDGQTISVSKSAPAQVRKLMEKIPLLVIVEAASEILTRSALNKDDQKNSPSPT